MTDSGLEEFLALHPEYEILGTIGRGGMSSVYLAEQLRLQRRVAIKVMDGSLAEDPRARERFLPRRALSHRSTIQASSRSTTPGNPTERFSRLCGSLTALIFVNSSEKTGRNRSNQWPEWEDKWPKPFLLRIPRGWCIVMSSQQTSC